MKKCFEQKLSRASKRSSNENERYLLIASYFADSCFFLYFSVLFVFVTYDYFYDRPFPVVIAQRFESTSEDVSYVAYIF